MKKIILLIFIFLCWPINQSFAQDKEKADVINYVFPNHHELLKNLEVPDFLAFSTGKATSTNNFRSNEHRKTSYVTTYYGSYSNELKKYVNLLESQDFIPLIKGHEGFYLLEKNEGGHFLQVHAYHLNEREGVQIEIVLAERSSKLSQKQIEAEILRIRKVYNEIVGTDYTKTRLTVRTTVNIIVYSDKDGEVRRIDIPKKDDSHYARFYYFENGMPLFAFFENTDSFRLYFYRGALLRNRYTVPQSYVANYDYRNDEEDRKLVEQMSEETSQILQVFKSNNTDVPILADDQKTRLNSSLLEATMNEDSTLVEELLEKGADVNAKDNEGTTSLVLAALRGDITTMAILLKYGADIEATYYNSATPLKFAVAARNEKSVQLLLDHGANPNTKNRFGDTPLMDAIKDGYLRISGILLENGANINAQNNDGKTALMMAVQQNNINSIRFLLNKGADVNVRDKNDTTTLIMATDSASAEVVQLLLKKKAEVNAKDKYAWFALMSAAMGGNAEGRNPADQGKYIEILNALLKNGAIVDLADDQGSTALIVATAYGNVEAMKILLEHGANPNHTKYDGTTALDLTQNNQQAISLLKQYGAKTIAPSTKKVG